MLRAAPLFLVALVACQTASVPSSDPVQNGAMMVVSGSNDPSEASSTGYSYELANAVDVLDVSPMIIPCVDCLDGLEQRAVDLSDGTCPTLIADGDYLEIQGDCTTSRGAEYLGRMVVFRKGAEKVVTFEQFALREPSAEFSVSLNGSYRSAVEGERVEQSFNLSYVWQDGTDTSGSFAYDLDMLQEADVQDFSGEIYVNARGRQGSLAVAGSLITVEGCDEPSGTLELLGTDDALIELDGDKVCDSCANMTVGGEDFGLICR